MNHIAELQNGKFTCFATKLRRCFPCGGHAATTRAGCGHAFQNGANGALAGMVVLRVPVAAPAAGTAATVAMLKLLRQKQVLAVMVLPQQLLAARDRLVAYRHFFFCQSLQRSSDTVL